MHQMKKRSEPDIIMPNPDDVRLTQQVSGVDHTGAAIRVRVPVERPLTLYLNAQEIVTMMTITIIRNIWRWVYCSIRTCSNTTTSSPRWNMTMICKSSSCARSTTQFEQKLKKRTQTSGCAQGTAFGDLLEAVESVALPKAELRTSWLYQMTHNINTMPSLYLEAGAIHGCVLCKEGTPVCYTEDVGRHNAVDKIAGWIYQHHVDPTDKILYTTGRLTSEMVIKTVRDGHSNSDIALRIHRLGRRPCAASRIDPHRSRARKAVHRAVRPGTDCVRSGSRLHR